MAIEVECAAVRVVMVSVLVVVAGFGEDLGEELAVYAAHLASCSELEGVGAEAVDFAQAALGLLERPNARR